MNPNYVTGFTDAEGCFSVQFIKSKKRKLGWGIIIHLQIHLHIKELELLEKIRNSLGGVGNIYNNTNSCLFKVSSLPEIVNTIIPFFDKYPLLTKKREDYELFKQVALLMLNKEHLTEEGFNKVLSIKASMRNGLTEALVESFPNIVPGLIPTVEKPKNIDPNWVVGFSEGEGCFQVHAQKHPQSKLGKAVKLNFQITQHERDKELLNLIILFFKCGTLKSNINCKVLTVTSFEYIINIIIPFFQEYPLHGTKRLEFLDFVECANLIKDKVHLTPEGLEKILLIKSGMNFGRSNPSNKN